MYSTNGTAWVLGTAASNNSWYSVCYGNGLFVAVSTSGTGNRVMTSPNGITWTSRTSAADSNWRSVCYGNGVFVAIADTATSTTSVMTSGNIIDNVVPIVYPQFSISNLGKTVRYLAGTQTVNNVTATGVNFDTLRFNYGNFSNTSYLNYTTVVNGNGTNSSVFQNISGGTRYWLVTASVRWSAVSSGYLNTNIAYWSSPAAINFTVFPTLIVCLSVSPPLSGNNIHNNVSATVEVPNNGCIVITGQQSSGTSQSIIGDSTHNFTTITITELA